MNKDPRPQGMLFVDFARIGAGPGSSAAKPDMLERRHIILMGAAKKNGGVVAKSSQDRAQILFTGPEQAINCALAFLIRFAEHNRSCDDPVQKVSLRQAVHKGFVELQEGGVSGEQADILQRLLDVTPPGRIFSTRAAYAPALGNAACEFIPLGWEYFSGLRAPVDVFEVVPAPGMGEKESHGR
jgi:class 3 adenylate cyclase